MTGVLIPKERKGIAAFKGVCGFLVCFSAINSFQGLYLTWSKSLQSLGSFVWSVVVYN